MLVTTLNGTASPLPLNHRGLAYGDGVFETLLFENGHLYLLDEHLQRLKRGIRVLNLQFTDQQLVNLRRDLLSLLAGEFESHVVKLMVLRHFSGRGYGYDKQHQSADIIVQIAPYQRPHWCHSGARVSVANTVISESKSLAGLKHLNRLDSVLARAEYEPAQIDEVLMATDSGNIIEGTMSNVFLYIDDQWVTPSLNLAGVNGIIRQQLINRFNLAESILTLTDLSQAQSAFICNSLIGLAPIISIAQVDLPIHPDVHQFSKELGFCD